MLMTTPDADLIFEVYDDPVMNVAIDVYDRLAKSETLVLRAKGKFIPSAVAIANIISEKIMKGTVTVEKITVDSDEVTKLGRTLSIIEITLART